MLAGHDASLLGPCFQHTVMSSPLAATSLATSTAFSLALKRSSAFSRARCCIPAGAGMPSCRKQAGPGRESQSSLLYSWYGNEHHHHYLESAGVRQCETMLLALHRLATSQLEMARSEGYGSP